MKSDQPLRIAAPEPVQSFNEFSLLLMPRTNQRKPATEICLASLFNGYRLKAGEQISRPVVARGATTLDFLLDLTSDAGASLPESLEPAAASLLSFLGLTMPFRLPAFCCLPFPGPRDLACPLSQRTSRTVPSRPWMLLSPYASELSADMNIVCRDAQQQLGLLTLRNGR